MADCQETLNELDRFLDSELSPGDKEEIMGHLSSCSDCQGAFQFHAELREVVKKKAQADELPDGFLDRLKNCFGDQIMGDI